MRTVHDLLQHLADNGGSTIELENGLPGCPPAVVDAAERDGLIRISRGTGWDVTDLYSLTATGWTATGRTKPLSFLERISRRWQRAQAQGRI